jgi:anti-sigma factor RsiW
LNLVAYIHHELPPKKRYQVSRHLDQCEKCYAVYMQQQDLTQDLARSTPSVGQADKVTLNRVWMAVQQDIQQPRRAVRPYSARYGVVALVAVFMLLIPLTLGNQNLPLALPATQPSPLVLQLTPSSTDSAESALTAFEISLTPEARASGNTGPSPDAISTP